MRRAAFSALAALLVLSGCNLFGPEGQPAVGGPGIPQRQEGDSFPGELHEIVGEVWVADNGCGSVVVDGQEYFAIWPAGSEGPDDSGRRLMLPNGDSVRGGDMIAGTGVLTPVRPLTADRNSYWANVIGYCAPDIDTALVVDDARLALPTESMAP